MKGKVLVSQFTNDEISIKRKSETTFTAMKKCLIN